MLNRVIISLIVFFITSEGALPDWGYIQGTNGPTRWSTLNNDYLECRDGRRQSPINICTSGAQFQAGLSLQISNGNRMLNGTLENLATTIEYAIDSPQSSRPVFEANYNNANGTTNGRYILQQFHFHWGSVDGQGTEHLVDGQAAVAEVHFVTRNELYNSSSVAASKANGFLVLGVRLVTCGSTSQFDPLFGSNNQYLSRVRAYPDTERNIFLTLDQIYNCNGDCTTTRTYYIYQGSLTTPPCSQAVTWWFSSGTLCISDAQLNMLRTQNVTSSGPVLTDNFRPDQSLNQRVIITNMGTTLMVNITVISLLILLTAFFVWN